MDGLSRSSLLAYLSSGVIHIVGLAMAHAFLTSTDLWSLPVRQGVSSIELHGSFEQAASEEVEAEVLSDPDESVARSAAAHDDLHPSPPKQEPMTDRRLIGEQAVSIDPPVSLAVPDETELRRAQRQGEETGVFRGQPTGNPERRPSARPPAVSATVALDSEFAPGELNKKLPSPTYNPPPLYPPQLLAAGKSGAVLVVVDVGLDGSVTDCRVHRSSGESDFDRAAVAAVRNWKFVPAERFGIPVAARILCPIRFQYIEPVDDNVR